MTLQGAQLGVGKPDQVTPGQQALYQGQHQGQQPKACPQPSTEARAPAPILTTISCSWTLPSRGCGLQMTRKRTKATMGAQFQAVTEKLARLQLYMRRAETCSHKRQREAKHNTLRTTAPWPLRLHRAASRPRQFARGEVQHRHYSPRSCLKTPQVLRPGPSTPYNTRDVSAPGLAYQYTSVTRSRSLGFPNMFDSWVVRRVRGVGVPLISSLA